MPFTGELGTPNSGLSNIGLGSVGGPSGPTTQTVQAKANILGTSTRTVQAKADIRATTTQTVQAKANITLRPTHTAQALARIRAIQGVQAKARILGYVSTLCEVDYNILQAIEQRCIVSFNVGDKVVSSRTSQAKARIVLAISARLSVTYEVNYPMPSGYVHRPTQRTNFRTVRTASARARIHNPFYQGG